MKESYIRVFYRPVLSNPLLVEGLPGFGGVGEEAARLLIEFTKARLFAELYSPDFPDYVIVDDSGICNLPRHQFHWARQDDIDLVILTGDTQPQPEELPAYYAVCGLIMDFAQELGCKFVISLGGVPATRGRHQVYIASTLPSILESLKEDGVAIYRNGRIVGATGLLPGLARIYGIQGLCILGATNRPFGDREAGFRVFRLLMKALKSPAVRSAILRP